MANIINDYDAQTGKVYDQGANDGEGDWVNANDYIARHPDFRLPTGAEIMKMVTGLLPNPSNLQMSDALAALKTEAAAQPPTGAEIMKMVTGLLPNPNNLQMSDALAALKTEAAVTPTGLLASTTPAPTSAEIGKMLVGLLPNPNNLTSADMAAAATREGILNPTVSAATAPAATAPAATAPAATNLLTGSGSIVDDTVGPVNTRGVNTGVTTAPAKTEAELNQERMDLISQVNHVNVGNEQTKVATQDIAAATIGIPQSIIDKMNATGAPVLENGIYYQPIYGDERGSGETYERGSPTSYVSYSEAENKAGGAYTTHDLTGKEISTGVQQEVDTGLKSMIAPLLAGVAMAVGLPPSGFESIFGTAGTTAAESVAASTVVPGTGMTLAELTQLDLSIGGTGAGIDLAASMTGVPAATLASEVISTVAASPAVAAVVPEAAATISQVVGSDLAALSGTAGATTLTAAETAALTGGAATTAGGGLLTAPATTAALTSSQVAAAAPSAFAGETLANAGLLSGGGAALAPAAVAPSAFAGETLADAGLLSGGTGMTAAVAPAAAAAGTTAAVAPAAAAGTTAAVAPAAAAAGTTAAALAPAAAGTAAATGLLSGAASTVGSTLASSLLSPGGISGMLTGAGGYLQTQEAKDAAKLAAANITAATTAGVAGSQFKPIGTTTRFGTSQFGYDPTTGQMTSAGYTLSPEAKAQQDRFVALQNAGLTQAEQAQAQFAPLQTGAQSMFSLGNQYLAQNPQDVAGNYLKQQMALLAPGRELELANLQNKLQQQGRGGLSVAQGGGYGATTPELQAMYNARAMQEAQLAANAEQAGQRNVLFGAGLLGQGSTAMGNYYTGQQQAYTPYTTASGQVQGLEALGQAPMTTSLGIGRDVSTAGYRAGALGVQGAEAAGKMSTGAAATANPLGNFLQAAGAPSSVWGTALSTALGAAPASWDFSSSNPYAALNPYFTAAPPP